MVFLVRLFFTLSFSIINNVNVSLKSLNIWILLKDRILEPGEHLSRRLRSLQNRFLLVFNSYMDSFL